jgi:putative membrane protein
MSSYPEPDSTRQAKGDIELSPGMRDRLALERTMLANERTLLAYVRTALALIIAGAGVVHFFDTDPALVAGWLMILIGLAIVGIGVWRYLTMRRTLRRQDGAIRGIGSHELRRQRLKE